MSIRKFSKNVAGMKQPTAREFEDVLLVSDRSLSLCHSLTELIQCAIPSFEGLLPSPHNEIILDLLFHLAAWHGLAKLRQHTDRTLKLLQEATRSLGAQLRHFRRTTCAMYETRDTPTEAARGRRRAALSLAGPSRVQSSAQLRQTSRKGKERAGDNRTLEIMEQAADREPSKTTTKKKEFNMNTFKTHSLDHYVATIRRLGTTDSYSTETVSEHHLFINPFINANFRVNVSISVQKNTTREQTKSNPRLKLRFMNAEKL